MNIAHQQTGFFTTDLADRDVDRPRRDLAAVEAGTAPVEAVAPVGQLALTEPGAALATGDGVARDPAQAKTVQTRACKLGHKPSCRPGT